MVCVRLRRTRFKLVGRGVPLSNWTEPGRPLSDCVVATRKESFPGLCLGRQHTKSRSCLEQEEAAQVRALSPDGLAPPVVDDPPDLPHSQAQPVVGLPATWRTMRRWRLRRRGPASWSKSGALRRICRPAPTALLSAWLLGSPSPLRCACAGTP
jgi:hypothetical protein